MNEKYKLKKLKLEDLKIGMRVGMKQLLNIYNTFMYLSNCQFDDEYLDTFGTLEYFGDKSIDEVGLKQGEVMTIFVPISEGMDD